MEAIIIEKITAQLLHLLTTNPDLQRSLLEHYTMTIQHLGMPIPLHATEVFLNGLKQLSDAHWIAGLGVASQSYCCLAETCAT